MELLDDFLLTLSEDDVLHGEGADPAIVRAKRPILLKAASDALQEGSKILHPAALFHKIPIIEHRHEQLLLEGGKDLVSPLVARHLAGAEQIMLAVCTIGPGLEDLVTSLMEKNPLLGLALDGLGNAAVEKTAQTVCERIGKQAQSKGLTTSGPLSPGESEWPVGIGQPQIFSLIDPSQIGIKLTSGGMMIPKKSISFVLGIGTEMERTDQCVLCSMREKCRYRHE
jgi:hypothetical protein